jgi:hypothetical protein
MMKKKSPGQEGCSRRRPMTSRQRTRGTASAFLSFNSLWGKWTGTLTDKERIIVVEGKLEISGAVSETIFRPR